MSNLKIKRCHKDLDNRGSGIAPAIMASLHFDVPCLFAKRLNQVR